MTTCCVTLTHNTLYWYITDKNKMQVVSMNGIFIVKY